MSQRVFAVIEIVMSPRALHCPVFQKAPILLPIFILNLNNNNNNNIIIIKSLFIEDNILS